MLKKSGVYDELLTSFTLFSSKRVERNLAFYKTYFILGRRANYAIVNPHAVVEALNRIFILFRGISAENRHFSKWVFSFQLKHAPVARWFGWTLGGGVYSRLSKNNGIISNNGLILGVKGSMVAYTFLTYIGVDIAFVLSSKNSGGRAELLTQRAILTIGFDGSEVWNYAYNLPGIRSTKSVILYARIFTMILSKLAQIQY